MTKEILCAILNSNSHAFFINTIKSTKLNKKGNTNSYIIETL